MPSAFLITTRAQSRLAVGRTERTRNDEMERKPQPVGQNWRLAAGGVKAEREKD